MDLFRNLPWKIKEPSVLDIGTDFIKEETIAQSYLFLNNFKPEQIEGEKSKPVCEKKTGLTLKQKQNMNRYEKLSKLNVTQHKKCLKALQLLDSDQPLSSFSFHEQQVITLYNNLKTVIQQENEEFLKFVEEEWTAKLSKRVGALKKFFKDCGMKKRLKKFDRIRDYPKCYTLLCTVPLSNTEHPVHIDQGPVLLQLGSVYKLNIPDLEKNDDIRAHLIAPLNVEFSDQYLKPTKQCVSEDIYAEFLAKKSVSNVVISMSSLKTIIDNSGPDYCNSWDIPVVVKKYEENGEQFYVAYVDKPFPQRHISLSDIDYSVRKGLLKRCFRSKNNFSYQTPPFIKDVFDANSNFNKTIDDTVKTNEHEQIPRKKQKISVDSPLSPTSDVGHDIETNELISVKKREIDIYSISTPEHTVGHDIKTNESVETINTDSFVIPTETSDSDESDSLVICDEKQNDINKQMQTNSSPTLMNSDETDDDLKNETKTSDSSHRNSDSSVSVNQTEDHIDHIEEEKCVLENKMELLVMDNDDVKNETNEKNKLDKMETRSSKKFDTKEHNVTYRLWNLKTEDENVLMKNCAKKKDIKILVRSKTDGYLVQPNGAFVSTNIVPKLEYQREHGAQVLTKSELLRQWTTLHFNPFSNLLRVRIFPNGNKYMKVETLNLNKVTNECAKKQNFNPKENLGILYNVLSSLTNLTEEGNYILHHTPKQGPFAILYKDWDEKSHNDTFNLHDLYEKENCSVVSQMKWVPIDTTLVLPYHEKNGHMPGLFPPNRGQTFFTQNGQRGKHGGRGRGKKSGRGRGRPRKVVVDN